ncbi:MAG TPA: exonuclease domain-containing protein [Pseudobdellovibrionaceae bacterium]|nr:exonuclease domain-containing protein [Pseudobdellovibrionaceae bacterium]
MDLNQDLKNYTFVAFDTETSGQYPIGSEIVEFGAVKWHSGKVVDTLQVFSKPKKPIPDNVIKIHGITNEMLESEPPLVESLPRILKFIESSVLVAHHAPFDLGFMAYALEEAGYDIPDQPALCTSLLSRKWIPETTDHKLQTLIKELNLVGGTAHRALDDASACLDVVFKCFDRMPLGSTLAAAIKSQWKDLTWKNFSISNIRNQKIKNIIEAIQKNISIDLLYNGGSHRGEVRQVFPLGIVRNPDGDYLSAFCFIDKKDKRYYLQKIAEAEVNYSTVSF